MSPLRLSDVPELLRGVGRVVFGPPLDCSGELDHHLVIPADADGRPGYHLLAPGRSMHIRQVREGTASDFTFKVGTTSFLIGVCLGRLGERKPPEERALTVLENWSNKGRALPAVPPGPSGAAGEPAVEYTILMTDGKLLTEWQFDHSGWAFVVGLLRKPSDGPEADQLGRAALATWTWLPDDDVVVPDEHPKGPDSPLGRPLA